VPASGGAQSRSALVSGPSRAHQANLRSAPGSSSSNASPRLKSPNPQNLHHVAYDRPPARPSAPKSFGTRSFSGTPRSVSLPLVVRATTLRAASELARDIGTSRPGSRPAGRALDTPVSGDRLGRLPPSPLHKRAGAAADCESAPQRMDSIGRERLSDRGSRSTSPSGDPGDSGATTAICNADSLRYERRSGLDGVLRDTVGVGERPSVPR
jgi:hypothetical protein